MVAAGPQVGVAGKAIDRLHAPHVAGLVFRRMSPSVKARIILLREAFFRKRVQLYFRPMEEEGMGLSFIIREQLMIANSAPLEYNRASFESFAKQLVPEERLVLTFYQRDRLRHLRFVPDRQFDPFFPPVHYFRTALACAEV